MKQIETISFLIYVVNSLKSDWAWKLPLLFNVILMISSCAYSEKPGVAAISGSSDTKGTKLSFEPDVVQEEVVFRGGPFAVSKDGILYFVDPKKQFVVLKSSLANPTQVEKFIDLKEWIAHEDEFKIEEVAVDKLNRLILAETLTGKILRISPDARKLENLADSYDGYRFSKFAGLTSSADGTVFLGSPNSATIYGVDPSRAKTYVLNEDLVRPNDVVMDSAGLRLLVSESFPNQIKVYDLNHSQEMKMGWKLIRFPKADDQPLSIDFFDDFDNFLVVLVGKGRELQIFNLASGELSQRVPLSRRCRKLRIFGESAYLQSGKVIYRIPIPLPSSLK